MLLLLESSPSVKHPLSPLRFLVIQAQIRVVPDSDEFRQDGVISETKCLPFFSYCIETPRSRIMPALDAAVGIYTGRSTSLGTGLE